MLWKVKIQLANFMIQKVSLKLNFSWDNGWHSEESLTLLTLFEAQNLLIEFSLPVAFFIPFSASKNPSMHPVPRSPNTTESLRRATCQRLVGLR